MCICIHMCPHTAARTHTHTIERDLAQELLERGADANFDYYIRVCIQMCPHTAAAAFSLSLSLSLCLSLFLSLSRSLCLSVSPSLSLSLSLYVGTWRRRCWSAARMLTSSTRMAPLRCMLLPFKATCSVSISCSNGRLVLLYMCMYVSSYMLLYKCPHAALEQHAVSRSHAPPKGWYCCICVYMCPHTCCCMCVRILPSRQHAVSRFHAPNARLVLLYACICVHVSSYMLVYMCPHVAFSCSKRKACNAICVYICVLIYAGVYVSSCCLLMLQTQEWYCYMRVLILQYIYVSSC
jgi:hypothetical protein